MANNNNNTKSFQYHYGQTNNTIPQARQLLDQFMENNSLLNQFPQLSNLTSNLTQTNMPKQNEIWIPLDGYDPKTMEATESHTFIIFIQNQISFILNFTISNSLYLYQQRHHDNLKHKRNCTKHGARNSKSDQHNGGNSSSPEVLGRTQDAG